MDKYLNRAHAGKVLAELLNKTLPSTANMIVLALPRGGVPVAFQIAEKFSAPLDVFIVRKLGVPYHAELAMGAIAPGDVVVLNDDIVRELIISAKDIDNVKKLEQAELKRREIAYRGDSVFPDLKNKTVILVDDGIATGASMRAAVLALKKFHADKIILAIPVADPQVVKNFSALVDLVICPLQPTPLYAVGAWYEHFAQTSDHEVKELLVRAKEFAQS